MSTNKAAHSRIMLFIIFCAFISIGFPDAVLGVAWPEMRLDFHRDLSNLGIILIANSTGYFLSGSLAGGIIDRLGVGKTLAASTLLVACGLTGYAISPSFWLCPVTAVLVGFGSGAVDTGLNFYAADNYSNKIMSWLHAFFGIGAMIGPIIMASVLKSGATWRIGYAIVAGVTFALGAIFVSRMNSWGNDTPHEEEKTTRLSRRDVLRMPLVWLQIGVFIGMVGIEAGVGAWTATILRERFHESGATAGLWAGAYWGAIAVARMGIPVVFPHVPTARIVQAGTWIMLIASAIMITDNAWGTKLGVVLFGLGSAPMFPNLMTLTPLRFGRDVALHTIGFQVSAATAAGAIIPSIAGVISAHTSLVALPIAFTIVAASVVILESALRSRTGFADTVH